MLKIKLSILVATHTLAVSVFGGSDVSDAMTVMRYSCCDIMSKVPVNIMRPLAPSIMNMFSLLPPASLSSNHLNLRSLADTELRTAVPTKIRTIWPLWTPCIKLCTRNRYMDAIGQMYLRCTKKNLKIHYIQREKSQYPEISWGA